MVTLTETPGGWTFEGWSGDCTGYDACVVTMDRDRTVKATFYDSSIPPYPPPCHVPNVVGMLLGKAVVKIKHAGCRPGRVTLRRSSKARRRHVIGQSLRPGKTVKHRTRVNLTVGRGPKRK